MPPWLVTKYRRSTVTFPVRSPRSCRVDSTATTPDSPGHSASRSAPEAAHVVGRPTPAGSRPGRGCSVSADDSAYPTRAPGTPLAWLRIRSSISATTAACRAGWLLLDGQHVVPALAADLAGDLPLAPHGVDRHGQPGQLEHGQELGDRRDLVALGVGRHLPEDHAVGRRERADHVDRRLAPGPPPAPPQGLAVDGDEQALGVPDQGRRPGREAPLERERVEQAEHPVEGVVARHPVRQVEERGQPLGVGPPPRLDGRPPLGPAQDRQDGDRQHGPTSGAGRWRRGGLCTARKKRSSPSVAGAFIAGSFQRSEGHRRAGSRRAAGRLTHCQRGRNPNVRRTPKCDCPVRPA